MAVVGIVPAAGSGERLGAQGPKAFATCAGRPLLAWSLDVLAAACDRVVVAVPRGSSFEPEGAEAVEGGAARSESVLAAVRAAPEASVYVVHDAARPLVTLELVRACVAAVSDGGGWDGAIAAARVTDTVKEAEPSGAVTRTLDRGRLWAVQTPQVFRAEVLRRALSEADPRALSSATDDAALVSAAGGRVRVVEAPAENLKVTRPVDLAVAQALLAGRAAAAR